MKKGLIFIILSVWFLPCFAETIILKSGKQVEGKILEKTAEYIRVDFEGVPLTFYLDEIKSVGGGEISSPFTEKGNLETDKSVLIKKMQKAYRDTKREESKSFINMNSDILNITLEEIIEIDYENRVFHSLSQLKDIKTEFNKLINKQLDKQIEEGRILPANKEEMKKRMTSAQGVMEEMFNELKSIRNEMFIVQDNIYTFAGENKWINLKDSSAGLFWDAVLMVREEADNKNIINNLAPSMEKARDSFLTAFTRFYEPEDIYSISKGNFFSKPCYVLTLRKEKFFGYMKMMMDNLMNYYGMFGKDINFGDYSYKLFVSAQDYKVLGEEIAARVYSKSVISQESMPIDVTVNKGISYPQTFLEFSPQGKEIVTASSREEYQKLLKEQLTEKMFDVQEKEGLNYKGNE